MILGIEAARSRETPGRDPTTAFTPGPKGHTILKAFINSIFS
jgi:hypothetical protein